MLHEVKNFWLGLAVALLLLVLAPLGSSAAAGAGDEQVCDVAADYHLGTEQYDDAIRLHRQILASDPANALAHYHLGYAEGAEGNAAAEIDEYQRAAQLGLRNWDLFLNLGLGQLGQGDLDGATQNLRKAVYFGAEHPESHFNLALVYEQARNVVRCRARGVGLSAFRTYAIRCSRPVACHLCSGGEDRPCSGVR